MGKVFKLAVISGLVSSLISSNALATSLYLTELNTTDVALAGAGWAARANDASTAFNNPAGMTRLEKDQYEVGIGAIYISTDFELDDNATVQGNSKNADGIVPVGGAYYVEKINDDFSWGLAFIGYFGLGLDYDDDWAGRYFLDDVTLQTVGLQPSIAYKIDDQWSVGAGVVFAYSILEQNIAVNNITPDLNDGALTLEDTDTSLQFNFGVLYQQNENTRFGMQYLAETDVKFNDVASTKNLGPVLSGIVDQRNLADMKLDFSMTLPQMVHLSMYHQVNDELAILADVTWQEWSKFGKITLAVDNSEGLSLDINKNYKNTRGISIGAQYMLNPDLKLNTGISYHSAMVSDKNRTADLPAGDSIRLGIGGDYRLDEESTFKVAYELLYQGDFTMDRDRGTPSGRLSGEYQDISMSFFTVSYNSTF
jgi:long-chain fatty acid transport protein